MPKMKKGHLLQRPFLDNMAEREGFEPPVGLTLRLISSQVHSTELCHLSKLWAHINKLDGTCKDLIFITMIVRFFFRQFVDFVA